MCQLHFRTSVTNYGVDWDDKFCLLILVHRRLGSLLAFGAVTTVPMLLPEPSETTNKASLSTINVTDHVALLLLAQGTHGLPSGQRQKM